jgi:hypothetical protein
LQDSNFEVQLLTNATYGQMRLAMLRFKEKVDAGERDKTVVIILLRRTWTATRRRELVVPVDA